MALGANFTEGRVTETIASMDLSPKQRRRAVLSCGHHAKDAVDLAELLEMLDLSAADGKVAS